MPQYSPIPAEDHSSGHEKIAVRPKFPTILVVITSSFVLISLTIATYIFASKPASQFPQLDLSDTKTCGVTPTQARSNGCLFDVVSFSWLPPACYDAVLVDDFLAVEPWEWFLDPLGTQPVLLEAVQRGEGSEMYVSWRYHIVHCVFMWQKLHRALDNGRVIDAYIGNYNHTSHCGHMLMMENEAKAALSTIIRRKFVGCGVDEVITS